MSTVIIFVALALAIAIASVFALDRWLNTWFDKTIEELE